MKICMKVSFLILGMLQPFYVEPHGFAGNTVVELEDKQGFLGIKEISSKFFRGQKTNVCTYKEKSQKWKVKAVQAVAYCQSDVFFELSFAKNHVQPQETIKSSPLQLFYRLPDQVWVAAHNLREDDWFLCKNNETVQLQSKRYIHDRIMLYIIEVKKYHTFLVGHQKILTHNMFIPIATTIGMSIPFDMILGAGSLGCMFGTATFCYSIAVGGIAAVIAYQGSKEKRTEFSLVCNDVHGWNMTTQSHDTDQGVSDAQAPGLPTEKDGFVPKKNWDGKKVKHPQTGQVGWPDDKGNVWKPTGIGSSAHGGPHWDVISKDGKRHWNIMPGGKERGSK